jgi:hypothetical protein
MLGLDQRAVQPRHQLTPKAGGRELMGSRLEFSRPRWIGSLREHAIKLALV